MRSASVAPISLDSSGTDQETDLIDGALARPVFRAAINAATCAVGNSGILSERRNIEVRNPARQMYPDFVKSELAFGHLSNRLFFCPTLSSNAVNRTHGPGPVRTMLAMNQNRCSLGIRDDLQEANDIFVLGMPGLHVNMLIPQACVSDCRSV